MQRRLTAQGGDGYLNLLYSYSEQGTTFAEPIEQMLRSIRVQP